MQNISGGTFRPLNPPSTSVCHWGCPRCAWGGSDAGWDELCPTSPPQDGGVGLRTLHSLHAWGHGAITVVMLISSDSSGGGKGGGKGLLSDCLRCVSCIPVLKGGRFLVPIGGARSLLCLVILLKDLLSVPCWWPCGGILGVTSWGCVGLGWGLWSPQDQWLSAIQHNNPAALCPRPMAVFCPWSCCYGNPGDTALKGRSSSHGTRPVPQPWFSPLWACDCLGYIGAQLGLMPLSRACLVPSFPPPRMASSDVSHTGDEEDPSCCGAMGWHK